ncbi:folate-sensitive fragile site protein Fra10Ac1-domain-containing protein [Gilbertella persicaria]|uniref:folate-sensitive fragile site protein Fra10Ac1-domain-containing protein n=1 Tax=Gilbertella persicaria TaxID=101096 RepID=UPI00221F5FC2|nr:folate-sensitive fragile site protein Fra10Ac1-domain-containing protein [Gilbertella persicaria]KAI8098290.1 folate-sensitive fragile site protein Fra10Ac1-domain-containing protein [Gilbertella persicaria]
MGLQKDKREDAYSRHKQLMQEYLKRKTEPKAAYVPPTYKTQKDILRENHKFVRSELDDNTTWEERVAKKYYDRLFKEYAICELKYYKEGKIALRWRTEKEVVVGKGQFICASTRCDCTTSLTSWEVNFGYVENGEKKNELVKVRLCPECSDKLNYRTKKTLKRKQRREDHKQTKKNKPSDRSAEQPSSSEAEEAEEAESKEASVWSKPIETKEEKTKEEEYEDYFEDLLQ